MKYHYFEKECHLQHCVVLESANEEGLLTKTKWTELRPEVKDWLTENIGKYNKNWESFGSGIIGFKSKEDVMAFILRWS